jgi:hypothetical protein
MSDDCARDVLVRALRAADVAVTESTDAKGNVSTRMVKGDLVETQYLTEIVPHRLAMRLLCKFDVDRDWAWHPERIPDSRRPPAIPTH